MWVVLGGEACAAGGRTPGYKALAVAGGLGNASPPPVWIPTCMLTHGDFSCLLNLTFQLQFMFSMVLFEF